MGKFLKRHVETVFIMLGNSCNMNCVYCLQHPLVHQPLSSKVNPEIYDFLAELAKENGEQGIHLQFYGGEPLLYFPTIKEIVEETKRRHIRCNYSTISNGRALTDEMVDFFNAHDFPVTISWDGYHTEETRLFDVFSQPVLKGRILRLKWLGLSGVISSRAYPLELLTAFQDISDEYEKKHGYKVRINLDAIFDTGITEKSLLDVDYDRVAREMHEMTALYLKASLSGVQEARDYTKLVYIERFFQQLRDFYITKNGTWNRYTAPCGNGFTVLNLDVEGNLYPCHNTSERVGTIHTPFFSYMEEVLKGDSTMRHREKCLECPAVACCKGGCKLVTDKARKETYCKLKKALAVPVIQAFEEYGRRMGGERDGT